MPAIRNHPRGWYRLRGGRPETLNMTATSATTTQEPTVTTRAKHAKPSPFKLAAEAITLPVAALVVAASAFLMTAPITNGADAS